MGGCGNMPHTTKGSSRRVPVARGTSQQACAVREAALAVPEMTRPAFRSSERRSFLIDRTVFGKDKEKGSVLCMDFSFLWQGLLSITWRQAVMYVVGGLLIYLAIEKGFEPALLMPMGLSLIHI